MHPLHDYFAKQLAGKLTRRGVVVWYDPRREFTPFFNELRIRDVAEAYLKAQAKVEPDA
jgi:hypothetical protein